MENETTPNGPISMTPPGVAETEKSSGALIGTIIAIIVLVMGGFYLWNTKLQPQIAPETNVAPETPVSDANTSAALETLSSQATSDETASIKSDLNATNINTVDADLQAI